MDKIIGNYLKQANRDFPLDAETLEYLQNLAEIAAIVGNMAGDKVVLRGCEPNGDGTRREPGYVFLSTREQPEGEVLYWEGGATTSGMYVKLEDIAVSVSNTDYPKAYTRRSLSPGYGIENYRWEDFTDIKTIKQIMAENVSLRTEISKLQRAPLGMVEMWAGQNVPEGYVLCDGRTLGITAYPELYRALGSTFNTAISAGGSRYTTPGGQFRVPDLRGRFVVGLHDSDNDYKAAGLGGGIKNVTLTAEQMPEHEHDFRDYMMIPNGGSECTRGRWKVDGVEREVGYDAVEGNPKRSQTGGNNRTWIQWVEHPSVKSGGGQSHENRPPYYVLAYIMRLK